MSCLETKNNRSVQEMKMWFVRTLTIRAAVKSSYIRSCVILPNKQFLFADENNNRLTVLDKSGKHVLDINTSGRPFGIAVINSNKVAVSFGISKYIEILNLENWKVENRIKLKGFCAGICFSDSKLSVHVNGIGIQEVDIFKQTSRLLLSLTGKVLYITCNEEKIYYTDLENNLLVCCDMNGRIIWQITCPFIENSMGFTTDTFGNVFVAATQMYQLVGISSDGKTIKKFLDDKQGLRSPSALYYDTSDKRLLVCNRHNGLAYLYNLM